VSRPISAFEPRQKRAVFSRRPVLARKTLDLKPVSGVIFSVKALTLLLQLKTARCDMSPVSDVRQKNDLRCGITHTKMFEATLQGQQNI
jgi:hypothetical protein